MRVQWSRIRVAVVASVLTGCGLISGLSDLTVEPAGDDGGGSGSASSSGTSGATSSGTSGTTSSGTTSSSGASSSGASSSGETSSGTSGTSGGSSSGSSSSGTSSGSSSGDASVDAPRDNAGCVPSGVEVCDDNVDNDCNNLTDCADPACTAGYVCVPPVPTGWNPIWFNAQNRNACPNGYPTANDVAVVLPDSQSCQCGCIASPANACSGAYAVRTGNNCGSNPTTVTGPIGCTAVPGTPALAANAPLQVTAPAGPTSCTPQTPQLQGQTAGRACTGPTREGSGCTGNNACVPKGAGFGGSTLCIEHAGVAACPGAYASQYFVGTQITDSRTCTACTCSNSGCGTGTLRLYQSATCQPPSDLSSATDNTCRPSNNSAFTANMYRVDAVSGCNVATPSTVGGGTATVTGEQTVCCQGN
jgi:hypothetical protein